MVVIAKSPLVRNGYDAYRIKVRGWPEGQRINLLYEIAAQRSAFGEDDNIAHIVRGLDPFYAFEADVETGLGIRLVQRLRYLSRLSTMRSPHHEWQFRPT